MDMKEREREEGTGNSAAEYRRNGDGVPLPDGPVFSR